MNRTYRNRMVSLVRPLGVFLSLSALFTPLTGQSGRITLTPVGEPPYVLGDVIEIQVGASVGSENVTGVKIYIDLDEDVFEPVLLDGKWPFKEGIGLSSSINNTHGDSLNAAHDANGLPGWQLNYFGETAIGQPRPTIGGNFYVTSFYVKILSLPPTDPTVDLTYTSATGLRQSGYFIYNTVCLCSGFNRFANFPAAVSLPLAGIAIRPEIPDTIITPGSSMSLRLSEFYNSNVVDSADATWGITHILPGAVPGGASLTVSPLAGPTSTMLLTTSANSHFQQISELSVSGTDTAANPDKFFSTSQTFTIIVDHLPVFDQPIPDTLIFDEDIVFGDIGNGVGGLFTDLDDFNTNITATLDSTNFISVSYNANDSIFFTPLQDWSGITSGRLRIEDALGQAIDSLLIFKVIAVNDTPSFDMSTLTSPGDTIILHHLESDTLNLLSVSNDVDNTDGELFFARTFLGPASDATHLVAGISGSSLTLSTTDDGFYGNIVLEISVSDLEPAIALDTIVVSIRSWSPVIDTIATIIVLAGTPDTLDLDPLVFDEDTPDNAMSWSFSIEGFVDSVADANVTLNFLTATRQLEIITPPLYDALDRLKLYVTDDDNNVDSSTARVAIFGTLNPALFPIPQDTVFMNRVTTVIDLDDFVADPVWPVDSLSWTVTGWTSSQIPPEITNPGHFLIITTNETFFGWDTLTFIVSHPDTVGLSDTTSLVLRIIPETDTPPVWLAFEDFQVVYPDTTEIGLLTDFVIDDFTDPINLIYGYSQNPSGTQLLILIDPVTHQAQVIDTSQTVYSTWIIFSAEDESAQISYSDTVRMSVQDSYRPIWLPIPNVRMPTSSTRTDSITRYLSDFDTPIANMTIIVQASHSGITVSYNAASRFVTYISKSFATEVAVTFTAIDPEGNVTKKSITVYVSDPPDPYPPEGLTTYYFNSIQKERIEYIIVADSTTTKLTTTYIFNDRERTLNLVKEDTSGSTFTWFAQDRLQSAGVYQLITEVSDAVNNPNRMSLTLTVELSKKIGGTLVTPDGRLSASYPAMEIPEGHLVIISETDSWHEKRARIYKSGDENTDQEYDLDTNLPEEILLTLTYRPNKGGDYYSFYDVSDGARLQIQTYRMGDGLFTAYVSTGKTVTFGKSVTRAGDALPMAAELWAHPNPFNATLQIRFMLKTHDRGNIAIYNLLGQQVFATSQSFMAPGIHTVVWHGRDLNGRSVPSGIYFVRLATASGLSQLRKVTLLK